VFDELILTVRSEGRILQNAGEVGDGPDQGHSGGADSVPPAPISKRAAAQMARNSKQRIAACEWQKPC
jgi:hypothetical protein